MYRSDPDLETIVYYNKGTKCLIRLAVSLFSLLQQKEKRLVIVILEGETPEWFLNYLERLRMDGEGLSVEFLTIPETGMRPLVVKTYLWKVLKKEIQSYPLRAFLFLDADTVVTGDLSKIFNEIWEHKLVCTRFNDWVTTGRKISSRIRGWKTSAPDEWIRRALIFGPAINTGIFGWHDEGKYVSDFMQDWHELTLEGFKQRATVRIIDEIAFQIMIAQPPYATMFRVTDPEWNCSVRFGDLDKARIIHYHGSKHCLEFPACKIWKAFHKQMIEKYGAEVPDLKSNHGDRRLKKYLKEMR